MSYQERIYNQNGKCNRNFVGPVPTTSSDICVFNRPQYNMYGASSINCDATEAPTCSISGVSYDDIFSATTECVIDSAISGTCYNSIDWFTNVYEDDNLVYSSQFFTSTGMTGDIPNSVDFSPSVVIAFDTLGYDYTFTGSSYTIYEPNVSNIKLEISTLLDYDAGCPVTGNTTGDTTCSCPPGYTATTALDSCERITTTAATFTTSGATIGPGNKHGSYCGGGAWFYPDVTNITELPLTRTFNSGYLETISGTPVNQIEVVQNAFWGQYFGGATPTTYGRLNYVGLGTVSGEWRGFSQCIEITEEKTYYIGIAGDNYVRLKIDGITILDLGPPTAPGEWGNNFFIWHVLPYTFTSGKHIIELYGRDGSSGPRAFGAEIYDPTNLETLTGATTVGETGVIFSTQDKIGDVWELGDTVGYSCPSGYALDTCEPGYICSKIENVDMTYLFTGSCSNNEVVCDLSFENNIYELSGQTGLTFDFVFTANTESFIDTNSKFKFEVYKYVPEVGYFNNVPVYVSDYFEWASFSGTSALTTTIPVDDIDPDGEYIIKGQFLHDVCTEFANMLGYNYTTTSVTSGEEYGLYQPTRDKYFVAFNEADEPQLTNGTGGVPSIGALIVSSIILDGTRTEFNLPFTSGDYIIALNGLTLAQDYDYSVNTVDLDTGTVNTVTLSGLTISGDILTYIYTNGEDSNNIKSDTFDIDNPIVSGVTDGEGSNTVYYNTDTSKYEIFLSMTPISGNDIAITLNGATLAHNIDYYQSVSNPKRIIFEGELINDDIVNAYYNTDTNIQGNQFGTSISVAWTVENPPSEVNGIFTVEISNDIDFTSIVSSATTEYIVGGTGYAQVVNLVGELGDVQYYRVKNEKNFITLCDDILTTEAYSEIANITIQSNINNSY